MTSQDCLNMLREMKDVAFATVDEKGLPQVRIIDVMLVENEKLYFCTSRGKAFHRQLLASQRIAIVGLNHNFQSIRLNAIVQYLVDQKHWIDRFFDENESMNHVYPGESRYILDAFCIEEGEIEFFDLSQEPIYREFFSLGNKKVIKKGYVITEQCIGCGLCQKNCPQQCIQEGIPFRILQNHCLHCGLCFEKCPVQAIQNQEKE